MADFWELYNKPGRKSRSLAGNSEELPSSQNETAGQCQFCGIASDDVLIGVCGDCA